MSHILWVGCLQIGINMLQIPFERFALQFLLQSQTIIDAGIEQQSGESLNLFSPSHYLSLSLYLLAKGNILGQWYGIVVMLFVFIHPDLGRASCVLGKDIAAAPREGVRMTLAEHVTHSAAGYDL